MSQTTKIFRRQPSESGRFARLQASARLAATASLGDEKLFLASYRTAITAHGQDRPHGPKAVWHTRREEQCPFIFFHFFTHQAGQMYIAFAGQRSPAIDRPALLDLQSEEQPTTQSTQFSQI